VAERHARGRVGPDVGRQGRRVGPVLEEEDAGGYGRRHVVGSREGDLGRGRRRREARLQMVKECVGLWRSVGRDVEVYHDDGVGAAVQTLEGSDPWFGLGRFEKLCEFQLARSDCGLRLLERDGEEHHRHLQVVSHLDKLEV